MSVVSSKIVLDKKGKLMSKMCVYCESVYSSEVMVCQVCNEYKGLMPLGSAITYLELDPSDFPSIREDYV